MANVMLIDDSKETIMIITKLIGDRHTVYSYQDGSEALGYMKSLNPDVILLDIEMPGLDGFDVLMEMNREEITIPVIGLTGNRKKEAILRFISLGAAGYLVKPANVDALLSKIDEVVNKKQAKATEYKILFIDDDPSTLALYKTTLSADYKIIGLNSPKTALEYLEKYEPDMIIMDYNMPVYNGRFMMKYFREHENLANIPVIILTGTEDKETLEAIVDIRPTAIVHKKQGMELLRKNIEGIRNGAMI